MGRLVDRSRPRATVMRAGHVVIGVFSSGRRRSLGTMRTASQRARRTRLYEGKVGKGQQAQGSDQATHGIKLG
jgi:hypothetical protein